MKLYTDKNGNWVGTQAEAKKQFGEVYQVEVPTDKAALLDYLNQRQVIHGKPAYDTYSEYECDTYQPQTTAHSTITKPHPWQTIRECAEKASLKDLGVAVSVIMNRIDEAAERYEQ